MRHGKKFKQLSRKKGHRRAMLANMASSLIQHKRINTTLAKAKSLRIYLEPLITKSKKNNTHSRRMVFSYLNDKSAVNELFETVGPKVADRPGGYCRIIKTGFRKSDGSEMAMIELVDFNEVYTPEEAKTRRGGGGGRRRRTRRGSSGAAAAAGTAAAGKSAEEEE